MSVSFRRCCLILLVSFPALAGAQDAVFEGAGIPACTRPAWLHCPDAGCPSEIVVNPGPVVEMESRRTYFLDYPCDLKAGEKVTVVLSLHGGGSYANWQRNYFPIFDFVDQYRLVVATPSSPIRVWTEADDAYLQNIVTSVVDQVGAENVKAFWLAGHSQGGATSRRLVCSDFFADKVDGFLSLSGGRVGGSPGRADFGFRPPPRPGASSARRITRPTGLPQCDFSFIYETGEREMDENGMPSASEWAEKYGCGAKAEPRTIVDTRAGYVYDSTRQNPPRPAWGLPPAPGESEVAEYPGCRDGRVVADVSRLRKGHTEGLEPNVTEEIVKLMLEARGGKISGGGQAASGR
jgi:poly(3-hydroxybutyrate) depolymerase